MQLLGGFQRSFKTYDDLGMRTKLAEQWAALMARDKGLVIIAGLPEGGLTTLTDVSLMETDRLLRDFVVDRGGASPRARDRKHRRHDLRRRQGRNAGHDSARPDSQISQRLRAAAISATPKRPSCCLNEVRDDDRLVITNVHAKDAPEALLRMLQQKVPQREFARLVTAVLCTRLIRKLCDACKVAYAPTPDLLKKLGIPAGKIEALYRTPKPEEIEKPCKKCGGLGFNGRTGVFELLVVDDQIREILLKEPQARPAAQSRPGRRHATVPGGRPAACGQRRHVARRTATRTERIDAIIVQPI